MGIRGTIFLVATLAIQAFALAEEHRWVSNAPRGKGYSIDLIAIEPKPGTPLVRGSTVAFEVSVRYQLESAERGKIVLVLQDEANRSIARPHGQRTVAVSRGPGTLALVDSVVVPVDAQELRLFIPLVPDGLETTKGEVLIRYPVTTTTDGPQYMPFPLADISLSQWNDYHHLVEKFCGASRRAFPDEQLEVFECNGNSLHLAFTTEGHPAHPAWVARQVWRDGAVGQTGFFSGAEEPFAKLFRAYLDLTKRTQENVSVSGTER